MGYVPNVTYAFIKWTTLSSPSATISITGIPAGYSNMIITGSFKSAHTATDLIGIRFNGDTTASNYNSYQVAVGGTFGNVSPSEYYGTNGYFIGGYINGNNSVSSYRSYMNITVNDFTSTSYSKLIKTDWGAPVANTAGGYVQGYNLGMWGNTTTAISSIDLVSVNGANFAVGTSYMVRVF